MLFVEDPVSDRAWDVESDARQLVAVSVGTPKGMTDREGIQRDLGGELDGIDDDRRLRPWEHATCPATTDIAGSTCP